MYARSNTCFYYVLIPNSPPLFIAFPYICSYLPSPTINPSYDCNPLICLLCKPLMDKGWQAVVFVVHVKITRLPMPLIPSVLPCVAFCDVF